MEKNKSVPKVSGSESGEFVADKSHARKPMRVFSSSREIFPAPVLDHQETLDKVKGLLIEEGFSVDEIAAITEQSVGV